MQSIQDITERQFEVLVVIRSLEEVVNSRELENEEGEVITSIQDAVELFAQNINYADKYEELIKDIYSLSVHGYIVSDADEEDIECGFIPDIEGITPKGKIALDEFRSEIEKKAATGVKIVLFENFNLFNINASLFGGVEIDSGIIGAVGNIFKFIGKRIKNAEK